MAEIIDIFNANLEHIGKMERKQAHLEGQWHRTFHCWIVSPEFGGAVLFQKRSDTMKNYPGLLDTSAAGHLEAGESVSDGLREVREELGIEISQDGLRFLGERVEVADQANGQKNREYQSVFLLQYAPPLSQYRPEKDEIAGLFWLPIKEGMELFSDQIHGLTLEGYSFEGKHRGVWEPGRYDVTRDSFLPRIQKYYLTTLIMASRILQGESIVSIS